MEEIQEKTAVKKAKQLNREQKNKTFYYLMIAYPVIQFCIFYIGVNMNSILLAFKEYTVAPDAVDKLTATGYNFVGFKQFGAVLTDLFTRTEDGAMSVYMEMLLNSFKVYGLGILVSTPLHIFFAFYISKKKFASSFFRVVLFLPSVISPLVMAFMFKYFVEDAIPAFAEILFNLDNATVLKLSLLNNIETRFGTLFFYSIWSGFGTSILVYNGSMVGIDVSITEAARLDGATGLKEFWYIVFPLIYPTFVTFFVTGIAGIFTNQFNLHAFFGELAPQKVQTIGYYLFIQTSKLTLNTFPKLSAMGLLMSMCSVPVVLLVRRFLTKVGPSVD